jgi:hypothetical protein
LSVHLEGRKQLIKGRRIKDLEGRRLMSADKAKVDTLIKRVEELVVILNGITEDLRQVTSSLKSLAVKQIIQPVAAPPPLSLSQSASVSGAVAGAPRVPERSKALEDVKTMFPEDLENLLSFEEKDDYIIIKPRQFLGSDNFSKIASAVRQAGGEYVSAGKASHFKVPKKKT